MLRDLYLYRGFVLQSIRNELVSRFSRSKLGGFWIILNPLSQVLIYALILSNILAAKLPGVAHQYGYAVYLMAGNAGLFVDAKDVDSIKSGLEILITNEAVRKKLAENAKRNASRFDWSKSAKELLSVFERAISKRNHRLL